MKRGVRLPRAVVRGNGSVLTCKVDIAPRCAENRLDLFPIQPNRLALPTNGCEYRGDEDEGRRLQTYRAALRIDEDLEPSLSL